MSISENTGANYRVLSLRLDEDTRAQLEVLAQLNERNVTDECRVGLEAWVKVSKSDPKVLARAEQVRAEIEREAQTRRNAITAVLGASPKQTQAKATGKQTTA